MFTIYFRFFFRFDKNVLLLWASLAVFDRKCYHGYYSYFSDSLSYACVMSPVIYTFNIRRLISLAYCILTKKFVIRIPFVSEFDFQHKSSMSFVFYVNSYL